MKLLAGRDWPPVKSGKCLMIQVILKKNLIQTITSRKHVDKCLKTKTKSRRNEPLIWSDHRQRCSCWSPRRDVLKD